MSPVAQRGALRAVAPPAPGRRRGARVADVGQRLVATRKATLKNAVGAGGRAGAARAASRVARAPRREVAARGRVPQPDAGGEPDRRRARVPRRVRDARPSIWRRVEVDADASARRRAGCAGGARRAGRRSSPWTVRKSCAGARRVRRRAGTARGAARGRRSRSSRATRAGSCSVLSVSRNGGRVGERLDAQLDEVGGVVAVGRVGRVGVGAVRLRERVAARARVARVARSAARRGRRRGSPGRGTRRRGRRSRPRRGSAWRATRRGVGELRRARGLRVEDVGAGPRRRPAVQRAAIGVGRRGGHEGGGGGGEGGSRAAHRTRS